jgi:hypothetical protein
MQHIRDHIVYDGYQTTQMQTDGHVVQYLLDHNLIDRRTYDSILNPTSVPPIPGQDHHRSHRSRLPQVEENVAGESSSSRSRHHQSGQRRRSEPRRDGRGGGSSHKHKSRNK